MILPVGSILALLSLTACAGLGRVIRDPNRICPPGHELVRDGSGRIVLDRNGLPTCVPRATPRPVPTCPPGTHAIGGTRNSGPARECVPDVTPEPTGAPSPTPTAIPSATPTRTPEATASPSPTSPPPGTPVPAQTMCRLDAPPWFRPAPPPAPVPVTSASVRGKAGFGPIGPDRNGAEGWMLDWKCEPGQTGRTPAVGAHSSLINNHVVIDRDGLVRDVDNGKVRGQDAWGRWVENGVVELTTAAPWWDGDSCYPEACWPEPTPTPQTPSGPVPDFRLAFTNVSNFCRNFNAGSCSCEPDGAHRFEGHTKAGRHIRNTVDRDHWVCAIEPCEKQADKTDHEWAKILQDHRDTYELGGGDEWIVASGIRHEWRYAGEPERDIRVATPQANPYQAEFSAGCGAAVEARGCMAADAYSCPDAVRNDPENLRTWGEFNCAPQHRRPVPGAGGCGPWKPYEVR